MAMEVIEVLRSEKSTTKLNNPAFAPDGSTLYYSIKDTLYVGRHVLPKGGIGAVYTVDDTDEFWDLSELIRDGKDSNKYTQLRIGALRVDWERKVVLVVVEYLAAYEGQYVGAVEWDTSDVLELDLELTTLLKQHKFGLPTVLTDIAPSGLEEQPFFVLARQSERSRLAYYKGEAMLGLGRIEIAGENARLQNRALVFDVRRDRFVVGTEQGIFEYNRESKTTASLGPNKPSAGNIGGLCITNDGALVTMPVSGTWIRVYSAELDLLATYPMIESVLDRSPVGIQPKLAYNEHRRLVAIACGDGSIAVVHLPWSRETHMISSAETRAQIATALMVMEVHRETKFVDMTPEATRAILYRIFELM